MDEKIVDIQMSDEVLPLDQETVLKNLQEIPVDVVAEYDCAIKNYFDEVLLFKNIVSSIGNHRLCKYLIEKLHEDQLSKLNRIALNLALTDLTDKVNEIIENTFNITVSTPESCSKATKLISYLKALDIDYETEAKKLALLAKDMSMLADTLFALNIGRYEDIIFDRLSHIAENDLDRIEIACRTIVNNQ